MVQFFIPRRHFLSLIKNLRAQSSLIKKTIWACMSCFINKIARFFVLMWCNGLTIATFYEFYTSLSWSNGISFVHFVELLTWKLKTILLSATHRRISSGDRLFILNFLNGINIVYTKCVFIILQAEAVFKLDEFLSTSSNPLSVCLKSVRHLF